VGGWLLTRQSHAGVLLGLEDVEQGISEARLLFGLGRQSVWVVYANERSTGGSGAEQGGTHIFEIKLGLLPNGGIGVESRLDANSKLGGVHGCLGEGWRLLRRVLLLLGEPQDSHRTADEDRRRRGDGGKGSGAVASLCTGEGCRLDEERCEAG
jgi:hypothetical protein